MVGTAQYILWGVFRQPALMFVICVMSLISGVSAAVVRGMASKVVKEKDQGVLMSAFGVIDEITSLTGPLIFTRVYVATVGTFPQAVLLVAAGLTGMCAVNMWALTIIRKVRGNNTHALEAINAQSRPLLEDAPLIDSEDA